MQAPQSAPVLRSVELFAGAGGLALGAELAGFRHEAVVERDRDSCRTLEANFGTGRPSAEPWPVHPIDVRDLDYQEIQPDVDLLSAGVPCQPFSIAGRHLGPQDERNMFPQLVQALLALTPKAVLLENVRGLTRPGFARYFSYIQLMVAYPEIRRRSNQSWADHLSRLERQHTRGRPSGLFYRVVTRVLNAADYGVPQKRERVFIVAIRGDLGIEWSFPPPSHSLAALAADQGPKGTYWERHAVPRRRREIPPAARKGAAVPGLFGASRPLEPWRTVRDAISGLPLPSKARGDREPAISHFSVPGARAYVGHTGSDLDLPAKTLKAGDHGVPGGENMVALPDGTVRYFTIRESARLQTFPDTYTFPCTWTESMRQIGNAVPVRLAETLAREIRLCLVGARNERPGTTQVVQSA